MDLGLGSGTMTMTSKTSPTLDDERLRRMATGAMIDMVCMHSPAQFWLRAEGEHYDQVFEAFMASPDGRESERLAEELAESCERLLRLIDLGAPASEARG
jgi:hypothetical protein